MKKKVKLFCAAIISFFAFILLSLNIYFLKQFIKELHTINENYISLSKHMADFEQSEQDNNRILFDEVQNIQHKSEKQFTETKQMKLNYDQILEEQRKSRIDSVSKDTAVIGLLSDGDVFYKLKNYKEAYKKYNQALSYQPDNNEIRVKRTETLYLSNPMDSTKYKDLLEDIEIIKRNGLSNPLITNIEETIHKEKGDING